MPRIISANEIWRAGETVTLNEDVQIARGVTLTIEAGATVNGGGFDISARGTLSVVGTETSRVLLNDVKLTFGSSGQSLFPRHAADVNGDGRADLVGFGGAGIFVALGQQSGTFSAPVFDVALMGRSDAAGGWISDDRFPRMLADVNGDGRADLVGFGGAGVYVASASDFFAVG